MVNPYFINKNCFISDVLISELRSINSSFLREQVLDPVYVHILLLFAFPGAALPRLLPTFPYLLIGRSLDPAEHFLELVVVGHEHVHVDVKVVVEGVVALKTVGILI